MIAVRWLRAADFIELRRMACGEGCPRAYTVRIGGDGRVAWFGERFVEIKGSAAAVIELLHPAWELMGEDLRGGVWDVLLALLAGIGGWRDDL